MNWAFLPAFVIQAVLLGICYIRSVVLRPQEVDALCADWLVFATYTAGITIAIRDPVLQFACALHSVCFCIEKRYLERGGASYIMFIHTLVFILLSTAYLYGPRVTDVYQFMLSAIWPHIMEMVAFVLIHAHRVGVRYVSEIA